MESNTNNVPDTEETGDVVENIESTVEASGDLDNDNLEEFVDINAPVEDVVETEETDTEEEVLVVEVVEKITFADRAEAMGLTVLPGGSFHYADDFSEVVYKKNKTLSGSGIVDDFELPHLAIFTKAAGVEHDWKYQNYISDSYKFAGNAAIIDTIKESIALVGDSELQERSFMSPNFAELRHEIVIMNANVVPNAGTVYPMMYITNTYNGTGASRIVFGMNIAESDDVISSFCNEKFGEIKQIHLAGSNTELSATFGDFINVFSENINDMISENFNNLLTESDMMKVLDIVEAKVGKKRRVALETAIATTNEDQEGIETWSMNSWQLFLALTRFTTVEDNLNAKRIMENITERVLIIPNQMIESLDAINS